jgi:hypothetical protein
LGEKPLVALRACLYCEKRIVPSESIEDDQGAVKQLAQGIAKIIAPVVPTDEGLENDNGQQEGTETHRHP